MIVQYNSNGSITISDVIKGQYLKKIYFDYSEAEAKKMFTDYINQL